MATQLNNFGILRNTQTESVFVHLFSQKDKEEIAMKKTLALATALLLTLSLLAACGGGGSNSSSGSGSNASASSSASSTASSGSNASNNSSKAIKDVIPASALISAEEASAVMGLKLERSKLDPIKVAFTDKVRYESDGPSVSVSIFQEALYDTTNSSQQSAMKNGWAALLKNNENPLIKKVQEGHDEVITTELTGIGRAAYLEESKLAAMWTVYVFYDEYMIYVTITHSIYQKATAEENVFYTEKTIELSKIALENLKAIIG